ncbi:hypothetical protein HMPREF1551_00185 [Capnocytophaga sp. oral taxon 863 str. F0517]|nr:hypothetical protein HMPREF1551_00185 [Capnocytophaga sp. oral taxon 863 str. F0517]
MPPSLPDCKITILEKQSQENERREVRIYTIKENVKPSNTKKPLRKKEEAYSSLFKCLFYCLCKRATIDENAIAFSRCKGTIIFLADKGILFDIQLKKATF